MDVSFSDAAVPLSLLRDRAFNLRWAELPPNVIPLTAADPDFPVAPAIREAIAAYAAQGVFSYGPAAGLPSFRASVARYLQETRHAPVDPEGVLAVNSAAAGLGLVARHTLRPGDEAIVFDPVDFLFAHTIRSAGAIPVRWPLTRHGALDLDRLSALVTPQTRMLCVCNPHNPLGRCFTREELTALASFAADRGLWVLSDEIWSEIVYPPASFTSMAALAPALTRRTILVHGFSKAFGLAGLRIGYVAATDPALSRALLQTSELPSTVDGAATLSQVAATAAYDHARPWLAAFLAHLQARRDQCVQALASIPGVDVALPDATYVAFARVPIPEDTVEALVAHLRDRFGVAVVPGSARWFGPGAAGHIRICFATSAGLLQEGLDRVAKGLSAWVERGGL
jgi:aspartate/methionine/tyrosine aminotransferase